MNGNGNGKQAVLYARFSPRPRGTTVESIETQLTRARAWAVSQGLPVLSEHSDEYLSGGRADNRPGLQAALDAVCRCKGVLVCYSLSRLARCTSDACSIIDRINKAGADLASLHESIDTHTASGRFVYTIFAGVAELERAQTKERTSDAMLRLQDSGRLMSRRAPYGYRIEGEDPTRKTQRGLPCRLIAEDPEEQAVIAKMLAYRAEGADFPTIGRRLTEAGIQCRAGVWHVTTIMNAVRRAGGK
jgi:DNA invertase Pin-like site-specific DNA recombinase